MCDLHAWLVLTGCYASVSNQKNRKKKNPRRGSFSACNREQLCKTSPPFDRDKGGVRVKGKRLTPLYRQWGQLCSCAEGYCYCCSQILLSPVHVWWMNHLAIGQAASYCLCNKQKGFLHTVATSAPHCALHHRTNEKTRRCIFIHQLTRAQNNLQMAFTATNITTSWDLPWNNLETPGCCICCLCVHWSDNMCVVNAAEYRSLLKKKKNKGSPYIFAIIPAPQFFAKKNENKAVRHPQGSA